VKNVHTFAPVINTKLTAKVVSLFEGETRKLSQIRSEQDVAINIALDAMRLACVIDRKTFLKGNAKTNDARGQIKKMFDDIIGPACSKSSAASYQSAFWIAFEQGIPFQRDLNNKPKRYGAPEGGTHRGKKPTTAPVEKIDVPALHKTLSKALAQARILNQTIFAADLVDLITDTWPDFKETVLNK
jgi:hypothetical protein